MKRVLLLIIAVFITLLSSACNFKKTNTTDLIENSTFEEEKINYEIEQILFSKSFQSIEPTVEIITKNNKLRILASLGLSEYSSVSIDKIVKKGNEVNIHVSGTSDKRNLRLAVPQVVMELKNINTKSINDLKFKVIYEDYTPLKIKFAINDIVNKVQSHFKVSLKGMPDFNLTKSKDTIVWDIKYNSIFDKEEIDIPLVNLTAQIDANNGNIIESEKINISSFLDHGHVLSYIPDKYILYKKSIEDDKTDNTIEQLWSYNIANEEKTLLYCSHFKISSAEFSPDLKYISLLETNDQNSELYIITEDDLRPYKVFFESNFNPKTISWSKDNILYLIDNNKKSTVYSYNAENQIIDLIGTINKNIESLIIIDDKFIIIEKNEDDINSIISLTTNWKSFKNIALGFRPRFINENMISYLQKDNKNDLNSLIIYDLESRTNIRNINENILNYEILPDGNIVYINKNIDNNNFTLFKYFIDNKSISEIANLIGEKIYYDESKNTAYLNIVLPFENEKTEVIYAIDLTKLN